jgi:hypothetical protein
MAPPPAAALGVVGMGAALLPASPVVLDGFERLA